MEHQKSEAPTYSVISLKAAKLPSQYEGMIFSKWMRSLRYGNPLFKKVDHKDFYKNYHVFIEKILAKPDTIVRLAVLSDNHDVVLGFAVSREDVLDYIHVHKDYRQNGIGTLLLPPDITTFTHLTKTWFPIWQTKYKEWRFNPFA